MQYFIWTRNIGLVKLNLINMKFLTIISFFIFNFNLVFASEFLTYLESAHKNNPTLNAERENYKAIKENINISRSEFLPSVSISSDQTNTKSTNRTNRSGASLSDTSLDSEKKTVSIDQKIFQGFKGYNALKKSELEFKKADFELKQIKQQTILNTTTAYFDFIFKNKNEKFNLSNVNLFERQVESDSARLQKGEITLTDLAQSESSLAGANANLIKATTELLASMENAIAVQHQDNFASHRDWLSALTKEYYDPMYSYQLEKKKELVVFRGNRSEVIEYLTCHSERM